MRVFVVNVVARRCETGPDDFVVEPAGSDVEPMRQECERTRMPKLLGHIVRGPLRWRTAGGSSRIVRCDFVCNATIGSTHVRRPNKRRVFVERCLFACKRRANLGRAIDVIDLVSAALLRLLEGVAAHSSPPKP